MDQKERIRNAYRSLGGKQTFYDGMITCMDYSPEMLERAERRDLNGTGRGKMMEKEDRKRGKTDLLLKIGIIGAVIILAGDLLMGWGVRDTGIPGIAGQLSPYLTISDSRMFLASVFGLIGVPLAVIGHFGIYKLIKPLSRKYAGLYAIGNLGFLMIGGAGVHVSSVEAAFFYRSMAAADPAAAPDLTVRFAVCFLLLQYSIMFLSWGVMVYAQMRTAFGGFSLYPRRCAAFSMLAGTLPVCLLGLFGNHKLVNALVTGAFSLGNIWTLTCHLQMVHREKEKRKKGKDL